MTDKMEDIERDLSQSRETLKDSVNALGESLTLGQIIDELVEKTGLDFGSVKTSASNAAKLVVPGAVLGAGAALLIANFRSDGGGPSGRPSSSRFDTDADWAAHHRYHSAAVVESEHPRGEEEGHGNYRQRVRPMQAAKLGLEKANGEDDHAFHTRVEDALSAAKDLATSAAGRLSAATNSAVNNAAATASGATDKLQQTASNLAGKISGAASNASGQIRSGGDKLQELYASNPVLGVAVGVFAGALVGAAIPQSRKEQAMFEKPLARASAAVAEASDSLAKSAANKMKSAAEKAKSA